MELMHYVRSEMYPRSQEYESCSRRQERLSSRNTYTRAVPFEYEVQEEGKSSRPDYTLRVGDIVVKLDVKDIEDEDWVVDPYEEAALADDAEDAVGDEELDLLRVAAAVGGAYDPYPKIRQKVTDARKQFKEYKDNACVLALYSGGNDDAHLRSPEVMFGVTYSNYGIAIPFNKERGNFVGTEPEPVFLTGGKIVHRHKGSQRGQVQNTRISALLSIREVKVGCARLAEYYELQADKTAPYRYDPALHERLNVAEKHIGVIVWENSFAATRLPDELFRGPYDECWRVEEGGALCRRTWE